MRIGGRIAALVAAASIVFLGVGYLESPAWTLGRMKTAAEANDADSLNSFIDYPALREDLKAEIMARMMVEAGKDRSGFGSLGIAVGSAMLGPMIDGLVSPAGMRAALIARRNRKSGPPAPAAADALALPKNPLTVRRGFSEFLVTTANRPDSGLVFRRHGLGWKLSGVDLPPDPQ